MTGTITVGDEVIDLDGLGLRDKSWGPALLAGDRLVPLAADEFSEDFAMMISIVGGRPGGMVLDGDEYHLIRDCRIESDWDDDRYQTGDALHGAHRPRHVRGHRRGAVADPAAQPAHRPDGNELMTRITEAMTRFACDGQRGIGMSEYLDQIVDGVPVGARRPLSA